MVETGREAEERQPEDAFTLADASVSSGEAEAAVRDLFGVEGHAQPLTSERDINFRIRAGDGVQYILKIANSAEQAATIEFQNAALRRLETAAPDIPTPRLMRTREGGDWGRYDKRITRLLTWLEGPLMHERPRTRAMRCDLGRLHAGLHAALSGLSAPAFAEPLLWDLQHTARLERLLPYIASDKRNLVQCALDRFNTRVAPVLSYLPKQVIHNDLNPHNVVVSEWGEAVCGIIDFGDLVYAPRICDVAIAAAYHVRGTDNPFVDAADYVEAYHAVSPLSDEERHILTDLIVSRMAMSTLISTWRAGLHPNNSAYILRNAPSAWAGLEAIAPGDLRLEILS
jgi:hypothetical protein